MSDGLRCWKRNEFHQNPEHNATSIMIQLVRAGLIHAKLPEEGFQLPAFLMLLAVAGAEHPGE